MKRVRLGRDGPIVSAIGLGTWQAGGKKWGKDVSDAECVRAITEGAKVGLTLVDTAEIYGNGHSEKVVAQALRKTGREGLQVATKVAGWNLRPDDIVRSCEGSLRRLKVDAIDLYQIHWPDPYLPLSDSMKALEQLHADGKIRAIGVSNFSVRDLEEARAVLSHTDIVSNQVYYNLLGREIEAELLPYCQREGISVIAYSPLAKGLLSGKYSPRKRPKDEVRKDEPLFTPKNLQAVSGLLETLGGIVQRRGRTMGQVALNWLLCHPGVVPIPGVKHAQQSIEHAGAVGWQLTGPELRAIDAAVAETHLSYHQGPK